MRVAVLADIHGNLPALDVVLADIDSESVDVIVLNGDIADGAMPSQTLYRLVAPGDRALWVRGNTDRWLVDAFDGNLALPGLDTNPPAAWFEWCASRIQQDHRDLLANLPISVTLNIGGIGEVRICHATARDDNEFILVDSAISMFDAAFADVEESTVVLGHTHMPFDRLAGGRRFINAGSVGLGYGHTGASWLLLDCDVKLQRSHYDPATATKIIRDAANSMPYVDDIVTNIRHPDNDSTAMAAFTETVRQQQRS